METPNGGYRTSSATQCKLRRVTGEMVAPRRRSPNLAQVLGRVYRSCRRADCSLTSGKWLRSHGRNARLATERESVGQVWLDDGQFVMLHDLINWYLR